MTYIFDLDGTLIDSMGVFSSAVLRALDEYEFNYPDNVIDIITCMNSEVASVYLKSVGFQGEAKDVFRRASEFSLPEYRDNIPAKKFVKEKLLELKENGHSLHVLSASSHKAVDVCLKRLGLFDLFENVWSSDDFKIPKSNPQIYFEASKRLGEKPENIIFVDDNIGAIKASKEAGMNVVAVYDKTSDHLVDEIKAICDRYIYDFSEL